jgi:AMMECR1 domain-containing protein
MPRLPLSRARALASRLWEDARAVSRGDPALARVTSWIRTIALEGDAFRVEEGGRERTLGFPFPSSPDDRPTPVPSPVAPERVRFVVRPHRAEGRASRRPPQLGWRVIVDLRDLTVLERDAPHGKGRPLRLGLTEDEAWLTLAHARRCLAAAVTGSGKAEDPPPLPGDLSRLARRSDVGVALWTRGRLRGSVVCPTGPALRAAGQGAVWATKDARFDPLTGDDLSATRLQVSFLHAPRVPLSRREIETRDVYPDKAAFVSKGTRSGVFLPEILNIQPHRTLRAFADRLAREKAGLGGFDDDTSFEVCEVSEFIESADRTHAVRLEGPVAGVDDVPDDARRASGEAAASWLSAIQGENGALPLWVQPSTGNTGTLDVPRMAFVAYALAAYGVATAYAPAVESSRRLSAWLDASRAASNLAPTAALLFACYRGQAARALHDEPALRAAATDALARVREATREPLVLAQAASFFASLGASTGAHPEAERRCAPLRRELEERFTRARAEGAPLVLAEWAELAAAFPAESPVTRDVLLWLTREQLGSGAFPESTASDFVYSRGTGKVFEVLALHRGACDDALGRALRWLVSMQYRPDSMFFVPEEHRPTVAGGLRHDAFDARAWIDAAGHLLLGLARIGSH